MVKCLISFQVSFKERLHLIIGNYSSLVIIQVRMHSPWYDHQFLVVTLKFGKSALAEVAAVGLLAGRKGVVSLCVTFGDGG